MMVRTTDVPAPHLIRMPLRMDGWTCGRCGSTWSFYFHECPNCSAVSNGFVQSPATREETPDAE